MPNRPLRGKSLQGPMGLPSPLAWGAGVRLLSAAAASALLWLLVAWALGRI